jgi:hypothetical protein
MGEAYTLGKEIHVQNHNSALLKYDCFRLRNRRCITALSHLVLGVPTMRCFNSADASLGSILISPLFHAFTSKTGTFNSPLLNTINNIRQTANCTAPVPLIYFMCGHCAVNYKTDLTNTTNCYLYVFVVSISLILFRIFEYNFEHIHFHRFCNFNRRTQIFYTNACTNMYWSRDSVVSIATGYGLDDRGYRFECR